MQAILWPIIQWIYREVVVKFVIFTAIFSVIAFLVPYVESLLSNFVSSSILNSAFSSIPPGIWWFLDLFQINFGLPLVIAAFVARFLIRRLPVIG